MTLSITRGRIKASSPCKPGWKQYVEMTGNKVPDETLDTYASIARKVGVLNALLVCRVDPHYENYWRQYAILLAMDYTAHVRDARYANLLEDTIAVVKGNGDRDNMVARYHQLEIKKVDWNDRTQTGTALAWMAAGPDISTTIWEIAKCYSRAVAIHSKADERMFSIADLEEEMTNRFIEIVGE